MTVAGVMSHGAAISRPDDRHYKQAHRAMH